MSEKFSENKYARLLKEQGNYVLTVDGVDWCDYSGFMIPAYLPHCCPQIDERMAKEVLEKSRRVFVRWDSRFGQIDNSEWWYVLKRGPWKLEDVKDKKKRWMIRQGQKAFSVRVLTLDEVAAKCGTVAHLAVGRYKAEAKVESQEILERRIIAARQVPGAMEYIGCFYEDRLVGFCENYIQNNAVWVANMRNDPAFLDKYSSYALMSWILDYYLNEKKINYVLDGWRNIYHRTQIQDHLMKVFGFTREYAINNVIYSGKFRLAVRMVYPLRRLVWALSDKITNSAMDKIAAVLRQEHIRRACASLDR